MSEPVPRQVPDRIRQVVGVALPNAPLPEPYPFETREPQCQGWLEHDGGRCWYAVFGSSGPWLCFAPLYQIGTVNALKGVVPYLADHFRVVTIDLPGAGRASPSPQPLAYSFDAYHANFARSWTGSASTAPRWSPSPPTR